MGASVQLNLLDEAIQAQDGLAEFLRALRGRQARASITMERYLASLADGPATSSPPAVTSTVTAPSPLPQPVPKPPRRPGQRLAKGDKTAFIRKCLQEDPHMPSRTIESRWNATGSGHPMSVKLIHTVRSRMGLASKKRTTDLDPKQVETVVVRLLHSGPMTTGDIANALVREKLVRQGDPGVHDVISGAVNSLRAAGVVLRGDRRLYTLVAARN